MLECTYIEYRKGVSTFDDEFNLLLQSHRKMNHKLSKTFDNNKQDKVERTKKRGIVMNAVGRKKKTKLQSEWCKTAKLENLLSLIKDKRVNFQTVEDISMSPFAVALLADNFTAADFFLKQTKGVADFSKLLLSSVPYQIKTWDNSGSTGYQAIKELDLSYNRLNCVPNCLAEIEKVNLVGNPLLCFPVEFRKAKWAKFVSCYFLNFR